MLYFLLPENIRKSHSFQKFSVLQEWNLNMG